MKNDQRWNLRAGFGKNRFQKIRPGRSKKQNQYFISHNYDKMIDYRSIIKENSTFVKIHMGPIYEITNSDAEYIRGRQTSFTLNKL